MTTKQQKQEFELVEIEDVPASAALQVVRLDKYGTVEGLDEDELLTSGELDRMVFKQMWKPVLDLPVKHRDNWIRPQYDEYLGGYDLGAFGTIDFARICMFTPAKKARYKAEKLKEELEHAIIMASMIKDRIPGKGKNLVIKNLKLGYLNLQDITNFDMNRLANWFLRIWRLRKEVERLSKYSRVNSNWKPSTFKKVYREIDYRQLFEFVLRPWIIFLDYKGID